MKCYIKASDTVLLERFFSGRFVMMYQTNLVLEVFPSIYTLPCESNPCEKISPFPRILSWGWNEKSMAFASPCWVVGRVTSVSQPTFWPPRWTTNEPNWNRNIKKSVWLSKNVVLFSKQNARKGLGCYDAKALRSEWLRITGRWELGGFFHITLEDLGETEELWDGWTKPEPISGLVWCSLVFRM